VLLGDLPPHGHGPGHEVCPHAVQTPRRMVPVRRRPVTRAMVRHGSVTACAEHRSVVVDPSVLWAQVQVGMN
jgi:hypothetical protein